MMFAGAGRLGYAFGVGTGNTLTPTLGVHVVNNPGFTLEGLDYGLIAYHRADPGWGIFADLRGTSPLGSTSGTALGTFLGSGTVGVELNFTPGLALTLEGGYALWPSAALGTATDPIGMLGMPTAQIGLSF
jgi:hypothetical protein